MSGTLLPRLALGSANFGLDYGVKNKTKLSRSLVEPIISECRAAGLKVIDSAIGYGDSHRVLGDVGTHDFSIVTKLPKLPNDVGDVKSWVFSLLEAALVDLQREDLYGLLMHHPSDLHTSRGPELADALQLAQTRFRIHKVGLSVYAPEELRNCSDLMPIQLVQFPASPFDQRFLHDQTVLELKQRGVELHARSLFLQGLLLMPHAARPAYFSPWESSFSTFDRICEQDRVSPLSQCLSFAASHSNIDFWVIGVDSTSQLTEIMNFNAEPRCEDCPEAWSIFRDLPETLLNPSLWRIQ